MRKLGKYSGKIYNFENQTDLKEIKECCIAIPDYISDDYLAYLKVRNKVDCMCCKGCPESKKDHF